MKEEKTVAQFYASMKGNRGEATRMGTKASGLSAHVRGWSLGAQVELRHENGKDVMYVYETGGSNSPSNKRLIAKVEQS